MVCESMVLHAMLICIPLFQRTWALTKLPDNGRQAMALPLRSAPPLTQTVSRLRHDADCTVKHQKEFGHGRHIA